MTHRTGTVCALATAMGALLPYRNWFGHQEFSGEFEELL
jgi:hypothetical protein